jgi:hypothetical protein
LEERKLSSVIIDASELSVVEGESVEELADFLREKVKAEVDVAGNEITVKSGNEGKPVLKKAYLRVLLRKFLHQTELKEDFRVISAGENIIKIKLRREAKAE